MNLNEMRYAASKRKEEVVRKCRDDSFRISQVLRALEMPRDEKLDSGRIHQLQAYALSLTEFVAELANVEQVIVTR